MTLLQITETIGSDTVKQVVQAVQALPEVAKAVVPEQLNLLALILKGGWVMYPIAALSIMGFYIFFERYFIETSKSSCILILTAPIFFKNFFK
mgnify:CR=1 FL=1